MLAFYSWTIFLSAFLLFSIQPMVGKALLPILGGTPAVWNICMVFFQALLFGGYLYANRLGKISRFHILLWILAAYLAPHVLPGAENIGAITAENHPVVWLLEKLGFWIALPFLALASTSTLIQHWFGSTTHRSAKDPYFLYAASNFGSLLALISYPILIEPHLTVGTQIQVWRWLFLMLAVCVGACALLAPVSSIHDEVPVKTDWKQCSQWILYALIPSSLLLGVTTYIATDIASIPLLWIIPLILYLLSFILVYSRTFRLIKKYFHELGRALSFGAILCIVGISIGDNHPATLFIPLHLLMFFISCLICHGKLADTRPAVSSLGTYYLCIALGGVMGGMINSLVAPLIFNDVVEYPVAIILACWMRSKSETPPVVTSKSKDWLNAILVFILIFVLNAIHDRLGLPGGKVSRFMLLGLPIILTYRKINQPRSYAFSLFALYLAANLYVSNYGYELLFKQRTFFGITRVARDNAHHFMLLFHGSTLHGQQKIGSLVPLSYFHPTGPAGDIFKVTQALFPNPPQAQIGIVGMGTGSLASYARKSENWTYYELDPGIVDVATQNRYFTFLSGSAVAGQYQTIIGDARLRLKEAPDGKYSLLLMDAFSSDSIPTHLLTQEAIQLDWKKISPHGLLAVHISNRYFDLVPVIESLAVHSRSVAFFATDLGTT